MDAPKQQKIVVVLSLSKDDNPLILNGIEIAKIFRKGLCLVYNYRVSEFDRIQGIKEKIQYHVNTIQKEHPLLKVSFLILNEKIHGLPLRLANREEAILILINSSLFLRYLTAFHSSPVPFLLINNSIRTKLAFKDIVVPVDIRKAMSECALWCSYFGRFNHSLITLFASKEKNSEYHNLLYKNIALTRKLFENLKVNYLIKKGSKSSLGNSMEALHYAKSAGADLMIIAGSTYISILDRIIGLPEEKIVSGSGTLAVLAINPGIENYMLCEECG